MCVFSPFYIALVLNEIVSEKNETVMGLNRCRDIYNEYADIQLCKDLIGKYDKELNEYYTNWAKLGISFNKG